MLSSTIERETKPEVRYIKLGGGGRWEYECLFEEHSLRLGYESDQHRECLDGDWNAVREYWLGHRNGDEGSATRDVNQICDFYELPESTIWLTFHSGLMYWCNAKEFVQERPDGIRIRETVDGWRSKDATGRALRVAELDGRLTQVQAYRGTICQVQNPDYVLRRIRGEQEHEVNAAEKAISDLQDAVEKLVRGLWWGDFELLIDLIFTNAGWRRVSLLGKTQKSLDLELTSPATGRRAYVQVKSRADASTLATCIEEFREHDQHEMYFVCHSYSGRNDLPEIGKPVYFWGIDEISKLVCELGLTSWLINKRR